MPTDEFVRIGQVRRSPRGVLVGVVQGGQLEALIGVIRAARTAKRPLLLTVWEPRDGERFGSVSAAVARPRGDGGPPIRDDFGPAPERRKSAADDLDKLFE